MSRRARPWGERPALLGALVLLPAALAAAFVLAGRLPVWQGVLGHVLLASLGTWLLFLADKRRSRAGGRRIAEANLLGGAVLGGAWGAWFAMRRHRHKTRHAAFRVLVPLAACLHAAAIGWLALR